MAARYWGIVYSQDTGQDYVVEIQDSSFAGSVTYIDLENIEITYSADSQERFAPILAANASVKILINTAGLETFVSDLLTAAEGRFILVIRQGVSLLTPKFIGYVLTDLIQVEDNPMVIGYTFELRATDGLGRLKSIDYNNDGTAYSGYATTLEHIFNCINKLTAVTGIYSASAIILNCIVNWQENSRTYSASTNMLTKTRVHHRAFYRIDSKGNYRWKSCYDVLTEIAEAWGARIVFSDYAFWFIQLNELRSPTSMTVFAYNKSQGETVRTSQNLTASHDQNDIPNSDLVKLSGGVFRYYPPMRKITARYSHLSTINIAAGQVWDQATQPTITYTPIDSNSGTAKFSFTGTLTYNSAWVGLPPNDVFVPHWLVFRFSVIMNSTAYYLKRTVTVSPGGGYAYSLATWEVSESFFELVPQQQVWIDTAETTEPISWVSPVIPVDGEVTFTIDLYKAYDASGNDVTAYVSADWRIENVYLELLGVGTFADQSDITEYSVTNDTTGNSAALELDVTIGDGPNLTSPGHIEVENDATEWVLSDAWRVGNSGTYVAFTQLLINEIISGQITPVERMFGTFVNVNDIYEAHKVIDRSGTYYVFNGGTLRPAQDENDGEWWKLQSASGYSAGTPISLPSSAPSSGSPSGSVPSTGGSGTSKTTQIFSETFTSVAANTVTISVNAGELPGNTSAIFCFLNGQYIEESLWTTSGSDIEFTFDIAATDYVTVIFFIEA